MSTFGYATVEQSPYQYETSQRCNKPEVTVHPTHLSTDDWAHHGELSRRNNYKPTALRTPVLVVFCVFTITIFTLVQIGAAAFAGAPGLHALVNRSANPQASCAPGATCAPTANQGWGNTNPSATSIPMPGAPAGGSYTTTAGWTPGGYFLGAYLPTVIAILLSIGWKCIFARLKEMEPYYQMAKPGGAAAKDSLLLSYPGASLPKVFFSSLETGHRLSLFGAINMALITLCTLFASETLFITSKGTECHVIIDPEAGKDVDCRMVLAMRPILAWVIGVFLIAIVASTIYIVVHLCHRVSGISHEATSIAGIASLYSDALAQESLQSLRDPSRKYTLAPSSGREKIEISALPNTSFQPHQYQPLQTVEPVKRKNGSISMHPGMLAAFWLYLVAVIIFILYYRFVSKPGTGNVLENFMNSQSFGVRLFMTLVGLVVKLYWGWIEQYLRGSAPYTALASPHGTTLAQSVLVQSPSHELTALFYRDSWRHLLLGFVTLMSLMSEVLVITLNSVPFSTAMAYLAFKLSVGISVGILVLMVGTLAAFLIWIVKTRRRHEIPDVPECIADVFQLLGNADVRRKLGLLSEEPSHLVRKSQMRFALRRAHSDKPILSWSIVSVGPEGVAG